MTLGDTGPFVALIDEDDPHHGKCVQALNSLPPDPLIMTWPCLTEAMYLLGRAGRYPAQKKLWSYFQTGLVTIHIGSEAELQRMQVLMEQYRDTPMDLADASLVAAAETLGVRRIFTLDRHFYAYRIEGMTPFEVVP